MIAQGQGRPNLAGPRSLSDREPCFVKWSKSDNGKIVTFVQISALRTGRISVQSPLSGEIMIDRTLELMLYVSKHSPKKTVYFVLKAIYFADKRHLLNFGIRIHEDSYIAMEDGPVPSYAYDLFKNVKYKRENRPDYLVAAGQFDVRDDREIVPLREPEMDIFSESEIACLNDSIEFVSGLSFRQLRHQSHDDAWKAASTNGAMKIEEIIASSKSRASAPSIVSNCVSRRSTLPFFAAV